MSQHRNAGTFTISECKEFASFEAQEQRYIRRSLDVALNRADAIAVWARDDNEKSSIELQKVFYEKLLGLRAKIPSSFSFNAVENFVGPLSSVTAFDLGQGKLLSFSSYRFLYERILGASARPWLPSSFCAAASLPLLKPDRRKLLLQSLSEAAATAPGWSEREPFFFPVWVEKIP